MTGAGLVLRERFGLRMVDRGEDVGGHRVVRGVNSGQPGRHETAIQSRSGGQVGHAGRGPLMAAECVEHIWPMWWLMLIPIP